MATVFELLRAVQQRPAMYLGAEEAGRPQQLRNLEVMLYGYSEALHQHQLEEPGRDFVRGFGEYLRSRFGWSMSVGPVEAVLARAESDEEAWNSFWRLISDYRSRLTVGEP